MNLTQAFKIAVKSIAAKKARSALTMLGVIIGLAAVIILVSYAEGQNRQMREYYESLGNNVVNINAYSPSGRDLTKTIRDYCMEDLDDYDISVVSSTTTRVIKVDVTGMDPDSAAVVANKLSTVLGNTAKSVMDVKAVNVISEAQPPTQPSGPSRTLYTLVAFLAGLFAAIVIVVVMDMMNTSIRNDEEASQLLDAPVIGRFPMEKEGRR